MGFTGTDWEIYRQGKLGGGISFTEERLRELFEPSFDILELRPMREMPTDSGLFGKDFLWAALMRCR
jgi:hypothetical protein